MLPLICFCFSGVQWYESRGIRHSVGAKGLANYTDMRSHTTYAIEKLSQEHTHQLERRVVAVDSSQD